MEKSLEDLALIALIEFVMRFFQAVNQQGREELLTAVRKKLDEVMVGPVYGRMRQKCLEHWSKVSERYSLEELNWFLDCVLDESCTHFDTTNLGTASDSSLQVFKVINTVIECCPHLQEFSIYIFPRCSIPPRHESLLLNSLLKLRNLTEMNLSFCSLQASSDFLQFYSQLGKSCPQLAYLTLSNHFPFKVPQMLALTLGDNAKFLTEAAKKKMWGNDGSSIHKYLFDEKYLSPICKSLKEFSKFDGISNSSGAFLLRHFPLCEHQFYELDSTCTILLLPTGDKKTEVLSSCSSWWSLLTGIPVVTYARRLLSQLKVIGHYEKPVFVERLKWIVNPPIPGNISL